MDIYPLFEQSGPRLVALPMRRKHNAIVMAPEGMQCATESFKDCQPATSLNKATQERCDFIWASQSPNPHLYKDFGYIMCEKRRLLPPWALSTLFGEYIVS